MQKRWPWSLIAALCVAGLILYARFLSRDIGSGVGSLRKLILGGALLTIAAQIPLHFSWRRKWTSDKGSPKTFSKGALFYYIAGSIQLFIVIIFLNIQMLFAMLDGESVSILLLGLSVSISMLYTGRRLAPVSDEDQKDKEKMERLGLPYRASDAEMTKTALIVMGAGVVVVLLLAVSIYAGSTNGLGDSPHIAWWVAIPASGIIFFLIALTAKR